jgi:hypothetical protein
VTGVGLQSRKRRQHYRSDGKPKAKLTEAEAERRVLAADPRDLLEAYRCSLCDGWHVGHLTQNARP